MKALLADADLRRELMVSTIQATQAREGIETTREQADRAYYVVTESDKATFFDLERFRGGKRSEPDRREEMFVCALREETERVRFDVARRDFAFVDAAILSFRNVQWLSPLFRAFPTLDPAHGRTRSGLNTTDIDRFSRFSWEVPRDLVRREWVSFAKGGDFCRFFSDSPLVFDWTDAGADYKAVVASKYGSATRFVKSEDDYFKAGIQWVQTTVLGINASPLPATGIFGVASPTLFPSKEAEFWPLLGVLNSTLFDAMARSVATRNWGATAIGGLPVPDLSSERSARVGTLAKSIHDAKAAWDRGSETSTRFDSPWLLRRDLVDLSVSVRLDRLAKQEAEEEARIRKEYEVLNDEVYALYGVSDATRVLIEETVGERPAEVLWPGTERRASDQKRMEHVWRLLSYAVKRVVEADEDGIVPFVAVGGEAPLVDRVRVELDVLFPNHDLNQVEVGITNELKRRVKGFRRVETLEEWLRDEYFDYHTSLYQNRPIFWHIASAQGRGEHAFGAIVHYHKFDHDRLAKLRGTYLRDAMAHFRREAGLADQEGRTEDRQEWQAKFEEAEQLDRRLQWLQEGTHGHPAPGDCQIRTPWKSEEEQPKGWRPDLDDGVVVNIAPLQTAGVLRTGGST